MPRESKPPPFEFQAGMPVVLLYGREAFLRREYSREVVEALREQHGEVGEFAFDGAAVEPAELLDELRSYGLLQPHKLVILDNADRFLSEGGEDQRKRRRAILERYVESPVAHATLLLRADTWRRDRLVQRIAASGLVYKLEPPTEVQAASWCARRCQKRYGASIDAEAADALVARIGTDLDRLDAELGKLASYVGPGQAIGHAAVAELVGLSREQQAWAIQAAIASGDPGRALSTLRELMSVSRQPEQLLTWAITDLIRKLHGAARLLHQGLPPGAVSKQMRFWGEAGGRLLAAAGRADPEVLAQLLLTCVETDRRSKRGFGQPARTLEALTVHVTDTIRCS